MMNAKKMMNITIAVICGVWLVLAGMATPSHAETGVVAGKVVVTEQAGQNSDDQLNDELLGEIENGNDEQLDEALPNDFTEGRIEILIYKDLDEEPTLEVFFI